MKTRVHSVIFVCLGNICRSPIAEGVAKKEASKRGMDIKIDSAGTGSWHVGENPCRDSVKIAFKNSVDISSLIARQVTKKDFQDFDMVIALDNSNLKDLKKMGAKDVKKLGEFGFESQDVPDPYFFKGDDEGFKKVYEMIEICVNNLFDTISKQK
jgi:protein-tyrosine phosphatase